MTRLVWWVAAAVALGPLGGAVGQERPLTRIASGGEVHMANGVILAPETLPIEFDLR